ncbi:conserved protein, unknown function [Plasmodium gaboni]|uniref:Cytochrome b5 heme-binding domain-containing protein n=1 Tax=Plasmodium gaboni TaxID=647221 RepID=A0ABY1UV08_9APIC|nr:conserved protein, unknown function [Plasmodium gaboni]
MNDVKEDIQVRKKENISFENFELFENVAIIKQKLYDEEEISSNVCKENMNEYIDYNDDKDNKNYRIATISNISLSVDIENKHNNNYEKYCNACIYCDDVCFSQLCNLCKIKRKDLYLKYKKFKKHNLRICEKDFKKIKESNKEMPDKNLNLLKCENVENGNELNMLQNDTLLKEQKYYNDSNDNNNNNNNIDNNSYISHLCNGNDNYLNNSPNLNINNCNTQKEIISNHNNTNDTKYKIVITKEDKYIDTNNNSINNIDLYNKHECANTLNETNYINNNNNNNILIEKDEKPKQMLKYNFFKYKEYFTICEIKRHYKINDCWIIANGYVYDVSTFINHHPGGINSILKKGGGKIDATVDYSFHSKYAQTNFWEPLKIGQVVKCKKEFLEEKIKNQNAPKKGNKCTFM